MSRYLAICQFVAAATLVLSFRFNPAHFIALPLSVMGVILGVWAIAAIGPAKVAILSEVKPDTQLVTSGPYRLVRHPMYTALLLFCGGFVFTPFHWWKVCVWTMLLVVLIAKSRIEEHQLLEHFPEYANYSKRAWRFVPYVW